MNRMRERSRGTGPRATVGREALRPYRSARACPSHAFRLKQDGQDYQDGQDEQDEAAITRRKGLEDLNVYRCHRRNTEKRSVRPLIAIAAPPLCSLCSPDHKQFQSGHSGTTGAGGRP